MTFYRWLEPFIEQNGPFAPAACYAHSDFDFPLTRDCLKTKNSGII
ncbi:YozE family protein [Lactiplantibacillus plantarum]|nr:YozE family protein [Lactiplantibacillus plantarum]MCG0641250.1 hypothetical protein [Lactiplantibacillus plantarum]MCG0866867.1 hypothetical protein [Lactiplantibacillus plantarum]